MKILFDQGTPAPLRHSLRDHEIATAFERGWQGFAAIITTDKNLRYQQNLADRRLSIVVLMTTDWRLIRQHTDYVAKALTGLALGAYIELPFPPV